MENQSDPQPTFLGALWFRFRATSHQARRGLLDLLPDGPRRYLPGSSALLAEAPLQGTWRSDLWHEPGTTTERLLELGKVHNLRQALQSLHGVVIPAGETFSFWRQIGRATRQRGFAMGREVREGCLIPAIGGGLCQLSGALYNAALEAGLEVVERHAHTQRGVSPLARAGRDATVFWNYVDLRLRAPFAWRIEARLTADHLIVEVRALARGSVQAALPSVPHAPAAAPASCGTCGVETCFRHARAATPETVDRVAVLVDEFWPEFEQYLLEQKFPRADLFAPLDGRRWRKANYAWSGQGMAHRWNATWLTLRRARALRHRRHEGAIRQASALEWDRRLALAYARQLRPEHSHLVVSQNLLPFLWESGALGGRSVDVFLTRQPLAALHRCLAEAAARHPYSCTCADFRAPETLVSAEAAALAAAGAWITPHRALARSAGEHGVLLPWKKAASQGAVGSAPGGPVVFPASTLCRKGAFELRKAARILGLQVRCCGSALEGRDFWAGLEAPPSEGPWWQGASAVVLPAFVEHRPRRLLEALAQGVPVIATAACGLAGLAGVTTVPAGDVPALVAALAEITASAETPLATR